MYLTKYFFKKNKLCFFSFLFFITINSFTFSQELNAKVVVQSDLMPISIDKRIFNKLQNDLFNFLNNTKWSKEIYDYNEKIECNFILNLEQVLDVNTFTASLIVQASRPIYNTVYLSSLINITDREIVFSYVENQNIEYNEFRVQTNNPLVDNLSAIFSFYANMIVGIDNNSFSLKGGYSNFQKASNIANNAPEHSYINGWNSFKSRLNRYWMVECFTNTSYNQVYDVYYNYYRDGLDRYIDDPKKAAKKIFNALDLLKTLNMENSQNLTLFPLFLQGKADELIRIYKAEDANTKKDFLELIERIDPANLIRYQRDLN